MFERFLAVPLHFTIEFLGFLVVAGGAFLVMSRPSLIPGSRGSRMMAALGFGSLAVSQVIHGGSFAGAETDSAELLVALKALGMALILMGVVGTARPRAEMIVAANGASTGLVAYSPAVASLAVAIMALVSSIRGARELRRLALGAFLLAIAEGLLPLAHQGTSVQLGDGYELMSHLVRVAGYFGLASWLWTGVRSSIRTRFVASFVALLVAVVLALSSALTGVISNNVENAELQRVAEQARNVAQSITGPTLNTIGQQARVATQSGVVRDAAAVGGNTKPAAGAVLELFGDITEIDAVVMMDPKGKLTGLVGSRGFVARRKKAPLTDRDQLDLLGAPPILAILDNPQFDATADIARVGRSIARMGVAEIPHPSQPNRVAGIIALVDFFDIYSVGEISDNVGTPTSIVVGGQVLASTLGREVDAPQLIPRSIRSELNLAEDGVASHASPIGDASYFSAVALLESADGFPAGFVVLSSPSSLVATARENVTRVLFLVALGVGAIVLLLAYYSGGRITRPIQMLTTAAQKIREGDLKAQAEVSGEDEVGQLGETFNEMTSSLFRMTNDLRQAARDEHALRSRIEAIMQSMADGLVAVDADHKILAFNREAEQITGIKSKAADGKQIEQIVDTRDTHGEKISVPIFDLAEGSVSDIFIKHKNGDMIPVSVVSAALRDEEGVTFGGVAVLRDMTREREVERMKSEFLSNISHELRTPLTPIKGYAEILERKEVPPEKVKQFTRGILDSTARLERIVELLVDFSALEAGRLSPRSASVDLVGLIEKLVKEWEQRTPRHSVVVDASARLPKVMGDERLLRRSFEELIDNAVKFSPDGGTVTLQIRGSARSNGTERRQRLRSVEVTVSDEGIGIPPEDINKIFSDFHQLDGSETRSYGGLGLGLAFVGRIVEAHGGTVSVESEPDQGTRLTVSIPAARTARGPGGN
jgi:two-component system, OmpR family, sensor histidine kinase VicK